MLCAVISDIKHFAVHDGDGIRTTVFFKGCPLKCVWCHNPESIGYHPQLSCYDHKCISCMECTRICPNHAHVNAEGEHKYRPHLCTGCGLCENVCLGDALKFYGRSVTVEELIPMLLEDRDFYENSGGGVTLSGGECLMQPDFCLELLKQLKQEGIHTAVDTCGFVSQDVLCRILPFTDIFLYDLKAFDEDVHIRCTGQSNRIILENLRFLDAEQKPAEIRIPYVPGYNSDQMYKIRSFLEDLKNITKVKVLPYHNYAGSKYDALRMENTLPPRVPSEEEIRSAKAVFADLPLHFTS